MAEPLQSTADREEARTAVERQAAFCMLLTEVLAGFASCSFEEIDARVAEALQKVAEHMGADEAHVILMSGDALGYGMTHVWRSPNVAPRHDQQRHARVGTWRWVEHRLMSGEPVVVSSLEDWPPEAEAERQTCIVEGVLSCLLVPIKARSGRSRGSVGLQSHARRIAWSNSNVAELRAFGDAVVGALDREGAERALRDANAYHRGVIEASIDPLVAIGPDGRITDANAATEAATGCPRSELIGTDFSEYFTDPAKARAVHRQVLREGSVVDYALELKHREGGVRCVTYNASAYSDPVGQTIGVIAVAHDVTVRVRAEGELREHRDRLEAMVRERTAELEAKNQSLVREIAERKRIEQALRESQERTQLQIDRMPLGCILWGPDLRVRSWNPAAEQIFGYPAAEALGRSTGDLVPPAPTTHRMSGQWRRVILSNLESRSEHENVTKDGRPITCEWTNVPLRDATGKVRGVLSMVQDVTERKQIAAELVRYSEELRDLYNNAPCAYHSLDEGGRVIEINDTELKWLGYDRSQVVDKMTFDQLLAPSSRDAFRRDFAWLKLRGSSREVELDMVRRDGTVLPVLLTSTVLRDPAGRFVHARSTAFDRTERRRAEAETRKLRLAVAQSPSAVVITDTTGNIEYVNPTFTRITGYSAEEVLGRNPRVLKSGTQSAEFYRELWDTVLSGGEWRGELRNKKKNGELYWESMSISPIRDETGRITHLVAIKEDATERRQLSEELTRAKNAAEAANRAKSAFLAHMSHEIRTPMNAILGFSQLMLRDRALTSQQREHLSAINRSGEHLLGLISNILEMSKIEAGRASLEAKACDLQTLLDDLDVMFRARAEAKQLSFWLESVGAGPRFVVSDESRLRQILVNLLGNAVKFTREGWVVLRLEVRGDSSQGLRLVAEVEDTGPGIAPSDMTRLFQSFEQTESGRLAGGTGLGLAISREFARLMGGDLTVESQLGSGTVFRLELGVEPCPAETAQATVADLPVHRLRPGQAECRILIVDDERENRVLLSRLLTSAGFVTLEAVNGQEAIGALERWKPAAILMDLRMPVMDGYEAIRRVRTSDEKVPIIAVSASAFDDDRHEAISLGANQFITKPFRAAEVFDCLSALLHVDYVFGEEASSLRLRGPERPSSRTPERRVWTQLRLPPELAEQIRQATANARWERLVELIDGLAPEQPEAAAHLRQLADAFEYETLLRLLDGQPSEQGRQP
jgi:PAS domain S-box-containing protein